MTDRAPLVGRIVLKPPGQNQFAMLQRSRSKIWYNNMRKNMCMLDEIRAKRDEIYAIARRHKAEKLWVFGSCARREERPDSDVDFLVKWMPGEYSWRNERAMSSAYEKLLGSRVDLVASRILPQSLGFAHRVCKEAVPV